MSEVKSRKCRKCGETCAVITIEAFVCDNCGDEYREVREQDKLIEQMREALRLALPEARSTHVEHTILAALAAERGE
jgi:tRNA(Ile2) C34 agmatinyltransferase TiaS